MDLSVEAAVAPPCRRPGPSVPVSYIEEVFNKHNVVKLRGDWTKPNKKIEDFLQEHDRFGIPLNVMYSQSYPEGIILSELLTTKEIINTIKKMKE